MSNIVEVKQNRHYYLPPFPRPDILESTKKLNKVSQLDKTEHEPGRRPASDWNGNDGQETITIDHRFD